MKKKSNRQNMETCTIIATGTELTRGLIRDEHSVFLGQELRKAGIQVNRIAFIPDNYKLLKDELVRAVEECTMVIITGGLGPTPDDLTREVVADAAHSHLIFIESAWETIKERSWGKKIPDSNKKQAFIPEGFSVIKNSHGTACGFSGKIGETWVFALPGPPYELHRMFLTSVVPVLTGSMTNFSREELICSVYMVPESQLADSFQKLHMKDVSMQTRLEKDRIILTLYGDSEENREKAFYGLVEIIGKSRIRKGNIDLAGSVLDRLREKKMMLVSAESCTGGLLAAWITDVPGSSEAFWGSFVTYSNEAKTALLGVDPALIREKGAVSGEVVSAMTRGALEKSSGDICIAVSGVAGPGGGTKEKPVGTVWIGLQIKNGMKMEKCFQFNGNRDFVRKKTAITGLFFTESALVGDNVLDIPSIW